jgi:transposase-like protein
MSQESNGKVKEEMPNTEVVAKAKRRRFTAAEKLRVLREAEACRGSGEIGALLRREGLYSSYLTTWRRQQELGELEGLSPQKRGPKPDPQAVELAKLRRENERLQARLERAELIIDVQKKVAQMLGETIEAPSLDDLS